MIRPERKPKTWAQINAALARAEVNGAERALRMAQPLGPTVQARGKIDAAALERGIEILRCEADDYAAEAQAEERRKVRGQA